MRRYYMGIDPGKTGSYAFYSANDYFVFDYSEGIEKIILNIKKFKPKMCILEKVHAMPNQGVVSMFNFGMNFGIWHGLLSALKVKFCLMRPQEWRKGLGIKKKIEKDELLDLARRDFKKADLKYKKHHNRAEALMLAKLCFINRHKLDVERFSGE